VISKVGRTGSVDKPQLHFELRRGNRAVDPERYLGRRTAAVRN
jgi:murein DD-endopeptidase MepM/ murein hydrolase activator NlpD